MSKIISYLSHTKGKFLDQSQEQAEILLVIHDFSCKYFSPHYHSHIGMFSLMNVVHWQKTAEE